MELTQVGFIDCLRKVNQDKYLTLKAVREHFEQKVSKVISAKDYQIKCQRLLSVETAKKIVTETTKDSSQLFNREVTLLLQQYARILDLVNYFENVVRNQASVIALQEIQLTKLGMKKNAVKIAKVAHEDATKTTLAQPEYSEALTDAIFYSLPKEHFHKYEPFEFYGGTFLAQDDKLDIMRDKIYRKQEAQIVEQKGRINSLMQQVDELNWMNGINEQKEAEIQEKYKQKKVKVLQEKNKLKKEAEDMKMLYESYIENIQNLWQRDHDRFST